MLPFGGIVAEKRLRASLLLGHADDVMKSRNQEISEKGPYKPI
jgi:hypothetical protein